MLSVTAISLNLAESIYEVEVNRYQCRVSQNIQLHAGQLLQHKARQQLLKNSLKYDDLPIFPLLLKIMSDRGELGKLPSFPVCWVAH